MLLIVGGESDPNTQRVVDQAHLREIEYLFWNTDDPSCRLIAWDFDAPDLDLGEQRIRPASIYLRWNVFGGEPSTNLAVHETLQSYAFAWPQVRMLNRRSVCDINNKSFNLRLAIKVGFAIPQTMVLSQLSPLRSHPDPESRIVKPLGGGAHTRVVSELVLDAEAMMTSKPQFVQENLAGENLRLFSINGELTCFHLATTQIDYRDDPHVDVVQIEVPPELVAPARKLVAAKGFDYSALDFRCRSGFEHPVFLEINSFPMFVRFDDASQNRLANSILDFLS